jgi:hypothetical protein
MMRQLLQKTEGVLADRADGRDQLVGLIPRRGERLMRAAL